MVWLVSNKKNAFKALVETLSVLNLDSKYYSSISEVMNRLKSEIPDAILLDGDPSLIPSFEFCWILKSATEYKKIKVFIFSNSIDETVEIQAYDSGADDFIQKPIRENSAAKRILARLNSVNPVSSMNFNLHGKKNLNIDKESYTVTYNDIPVVLSKKEFELLYFMASQPGRVFTRDEIFNKVWKRIPGKKDRTIHVHILRLRKKLDDELFSTLKGIGYRFCA
jgi:two-component system alkaline phosphatase synthesis response regulator PhoP